MVFGLLLYLGVYSAAGFSLPSTLLVAAHPLSCLWGVGVVSKFVIRDLVRFRYATTLAEAAARSRLAKVTVTTFLGYLPQDLSGHLGFDSDSRLEAPAEGSGAFTALASSCLAPILWTIDAFRQNPALQLHVAAFVSLLLSARGLLLYFLASLPWTFLGGGWVRLTLSCRLVPLVLVLELLILYAGLPITRFTLEGGRRFILYLRMDELLAVARLGRWGRSEEPCASTEALEKFLRGDRGLSRMRVQSSFFLPLEVPSSGESKSSSQLPRVRARRRG